MAMSMRKVVRAAYSGRWRGSSDGGCFCSSASGSKRWRLASARNTNRPRTNTTARASQRLNKRVQPPTEIGTITRMLDVRLSRNDRKTRGRAPRWPQAGGDDITPTLCHSNLFAAATAICPAREAFVFILPPPRGRLGAIVLVRRVSLPRPAKAGRGDRPKGGGRGAGLAEFLSTKVKRRVERPLHHASHGPPPPLSRGRKK